MLVIRRTLKNSSDERGSTLVVVLIIMLVLTIAGMALAGIVTSTTTSLVGSRDTAQSRAAADAGLAAGVAEARRTGDFCALTLASGVAPRYTLTSACAGTQVTFTSTGQGAGGGQTISKAVYNYTETPNMTGAAELVFFNSGSDSVYFTNHVMPQSASLATILFPGGGLFRCKTTVPGNVITKGSIQGESGCTINGSVYVGGANPVGNGNASKKNALYLNNNDKVLGSAVVVGNVLVASTDARIGGTLSVPTAARVTSGWGNDIFSPTSTSPYIKNGQAGGILWSSTLGQPTLDPWFEYQYSAGNFPGYNIVTITTASTPYNCTNINASDSTFWSVLVSGFTTPTVVNTLGCTNGIQTGSINSANDDAQIGVNVVLLAQSFTLGDFTMTPKSGTTPSAWFVVPDGTPGDGSPTCPASGYHGIQTDASISVTVNAMMYTPCVIRIGNGGRWTGAMYAGSLDDGGDITIYTSPMALPGQWGTGAGGSGGGGAGSSTKTLGTLVSQRDVP